MVGEFPSRDFFFFSTRLVAAGVERLLSDRWLSAEVDGIADLECLTSCVVQGNETLAEGLGLEPRGGSSRNWE